MVTASLSLDSLWAYWPITVVFAAVAWIVLREVGPVRRVRRLMG